MQSAENFTSGCRFKLAVWALATLLLGLAMLFYPYVVFGYLVESLPWVILFSGAFFGVKALALKRRRKKYLPSMIAAVVLLGGGAALFWQPVWRDTVLWYVFAGYLIISGWQNLRPTRLPGVEKQTVSRYAGALAVWLMALLMLLKPRSGLSEALLLLSVFFISWGAFQLLLPPPRE